MTVKWYYRAARSFLERKCIYSEELVLRGWFWCIIWAILWWENDSLNRTLLSAVVTKITHAHTKKPVLLKYFKGKINQFLCKIPHTVIWRKHSETENTDRDSDETRNEEGKLNGKYLAISATEKKRERQGVFVDLPGSWRHPGSLDKKPAGLVHSVLVYGKKKIKWVKSLFVRNDV